MSIGRRALQNTFFLCIGQFAVLATGIVWTALLARYIGPETYGIYAYAQSVVVILMLFVNLGFSQLLVRDVAQKPELSLRYLTTILGVKLVLSILVIGGLLTYGFSIGWTEERAAITWLVTASYFLDSVGAIPVSVLHAHQAMKYSALSGTLRAILALSIGVLAIQMKLSFPAILAALLAISILPVLLNSYFMRKIMRGVGTGMSRAAWSLSFTSELMLKSIPFAALSLIAVLYSNIVILLLRNLTHDDAIIGNFAVAQRIYSMLFIVPAMLLQAIFPAFSSAYARSPERFRRMFDQAYRYMFAITVPMAIGLWITAFRVVHLVYGEDFAAAGSAVRILSLQLLNGVGYVMGPAMVAMRHQVLSAVIYGSALVGVAVAGYLAIPRWGVDGACWAAVAGSAVGFVVYAIILFRWLKLRYPLLWVVKTVVASLGMGVAVYFLLLHLSFLIVSFVIAPVIYVLIHKALKTLSSEDRHQLMSLMPSWFSRVVPPWILGK